MGQCHHHAILPISTSQVSSCLHPSRALIAPYDVTYRRSSQIGNAPPEPPPHLDQYGAAGMMVYANDFSVFSYGIEHRSRIVGATHEHMGSVKGSPLAHNSPHMPVVTEGMFWSMPVASPSLVITRPNSF